MVKRIIVGLMIAAAAAVGASAAAGAAAPGPGDTQCVPGQDAQPGPAQVGGTCPAH